MDFVIPLLFERFKKIPEWFYRKSSKYFNTEKFSLIMKLKIEELLDDKFSCHILFKNYSFNILNDFGDEDIVMDIPNRIPEGYIHIFTPCIIRNDFIIEVADFVFKPYGKLEMINHKFTTIPLELRRCGIKNFRGMNAFYYRNKILSLRLSCDPKARYSGRDSKAEKLYEKLPKKYQDIESYKWVNSPRVKLYLNKVK